jgi:hypothetical protein
MHDRIKSHLDDVAIGLEKLLLDVPTGNNRNRVDGILREVRRTRASVTPEGVFDE